MAVVGGRAWRGGGHGGGEGMAGGGGMAWRSWWYLSRGRGGISHVLDQACWHHYLSLSLSLSLSLRVHLHAQPFHPNTSVNH